MGFHGGEAPNDDPETQKLHARIARLKDGISELRASNSEAEVQTQYQNPTQILIPFMYKP